MTEGRPDGLTSASLGDRFYWRWGFVVRIKRGYMASARFPAAANFVFRKQQPKIFWLEICTSVSRALQIAHTHTWKQFNYASKFCDIFDRLGLKEVGPECRKSGCFAQAKGKGCRHSPLCGSSSSSISLICFISVILTLCSEQGAVSCSPSKWRSLHRACPQGPSSLSVNFARGPPW